MEMQVRYNSAPRLQQASVLASNSNLASPGSRCPAVRAGSPAYLECIMYFVVGPIIIRAGRSDVQECIRERDRSDRRPLIQHRTTNIPDPTDGPAPVHGAELRRRRTIRARVAHESHVVWEEPRVVYSTRKPVLDNAGREWSAEGAWLLYQWEEMQCDILDSRFAMGKAVKGVTGSMWTQVRLLELHGLGLGALVDGEDGEGEDIRVTCGRGGGGAMLLLAMACHILALLV